MYQLIKKILKDEDEDSKIKLLYACRNESEILLKNELSVLEQSYPDRLKIVYAVDQPLNKKEWKGQVGFVDANMIKKFMPSSANPRSLVLVCGPDP